MEDNKLTEEEKKTINRLVRKHYHFEGKLKINKKDADLMARIETFRSECRKINSLYDYKTNFGITIIFNWEDDIGFIYIVTTTGVYCSLGVEETRKTLDDFLEGLKKQAAMFKKAKKDLAKLIRLKNKLKLPGPVSLGTFGHKCDGIELPGIYFHKLTQEEIGHILKY